MTKRQAKKSWVSFKPSFAGDPSTRLQEADLLSSAIMAGPLFTLEEPTNLLDHIDETKVEGNAIARLGEYLRCIRASMRTWVRKVENIAECLEPQLPAKDDEVKAVALAIAERLEHLPFEEDGDAEALSLTIAKHLRRATDEGVNNFEQLINAAQHVAKVAFPRWTFRLSLALRRLLDAVPQTWSTACGIGKKLAWGCSNPGQIETELRLLLEEIELGIRSVDLDSPDSFVQSVRDASTAPRNAALSHWWEEVDRQLDDFIVQFRNIAVPPTTDQVSEAASDGRSDEVARPDPSLDDDGAFLSVADLAKRYGIPKDALRKRLDRFRKTNHDCYKEVADGERKPREPRYLYQLGAVRHIVQEMASGETSGKRPAKKN